MWIAIDREGIPCETSKPTFQKMVEKVHEDLVEYHTNLSVIYGMEIRVVFDITRVHDKYYTIQCVDDYRVVYHLHEIEKGD